jgi:hypothetical protein
MIRGRLSIFAATTIVLAGSATGGEHQAVRVSNRCVDEATAATADVLAARFDEHQFVFIGSTHGDHKIEEFLMCLVSRPSFTRRVTDIVQEQVSSAHQALIDRYVLKLESIPPETLTSIWFDTDEPTLWTTLPQVRRFVETLREVNGTLPPANRVRLVGGNEGIDWSTVNVTADLARYPYKTNLVSHLLIEHLAKTPGSRTLVVYGDCHIHYGANNFMGDIQDALGRDALFVTGRIGELVPIERTFLASVGDPEKAFFVPSSRFPRDASLLPSLRVCGEDASRPIDYIDGFVYLGPTPDRNLIGAIPLTAAQRQELARRASIRGNGPSASRARYGSRAQWFRGHPNDFPARPPVGVR